MKIAASLEEVLLAGTEWLFRAVDGRSVAPAVGGGRRRERGRVEAGGEGAVVRRAVRQPLRGRAHLQLRAAPAARAPRPHAVPARRQPPLAQTTSATIRHVTTRLPAGYTMRNARIRPKFIRRPCPRTFC